MDSEGSSFQTGLSVQADRPHETPAHLPPRCPVAMPAQPLVPWTAGRALSAVGGWLMEETQLPAPALPVTAPKRRA